MSKAVKFKEEYAEKNKGRGISDLEFMDAFAEEQVAKKLAEYKEKVVGELLIKGFENPNLLAKYGYNHAIQIIKETEI